MNKKTRLAFMLAAAFALPVVTLMVAAQTSARNAARPQGPCDIYAADGAPCVAAHSSTRALLAAYNGPLYEVMRQSDGKKLDIGVVQPSGSDAGGYADAAAQDDFCANTYCWITTLYDQSGAGNHLIQAPRGGFSGSALGGANNVPVADWAPVTVMGHKAYGIFIAPGMGLRWNDAKKTAVDDQAEGQYWVINGQHYNNGCCFDYGNAETDSRDDGNGTMETTYYGNATGWYRGSGAGPWIMTDQENNLVGCVTEDGTKVCPDLPSISWRFVTAIAKGEPHHWTSMGGDAQRGDLKVMFDGRRINETYDPMRKQGAILLGNGGDNSVGSQGTFYEAAMTAQGTFPSDATDQKVQANVVAARYDLPALTIGPASAKETPPGLQTFSPGSSQETAVTFTNTTGAPATGVKLSVAAPAGWTAEAAGGSGSAKAFPDAVAPGASVSAVFKVVSGSAPFNGDLVASAEWSSTAGGSANTAKAAGKARNTPPIKINEFAAGTGEASGPADSFIELYNAGDSPADLSGWTLTHHAINEAIFSAIEVPSGARLDAKGFYVLGLSTSGLAVAAHKGDAAIHVRSIAGLAVGDTIEVGAGPAAETRKIAAIGTAAGNATTLWQPLPDGPVITIPAGSTNVPVQNVAGFEVGQKIGLGHGATQPAVSRDLEKYEVATVTEVGKQGTQAWLSADAKPGDTNIKVSAAGNISAGDKIRLDIDSAGHGIETVTVTKVGTQSARNTFRGNLPAADQGTGLDLAEPLKFSHAANMPFSARGTGITFEPATAFAHSSNEPVQPLGTGITLDAPLAADHDIHAAVRNAAATTAGHQGEPAPSQWFGGPILSQRAGAMILRDAAGRVVDSLNYGGVVDPWAAEGYQAASGTGARGNFVASPGFGGGRGGRGGQAPRGNGRSAGRFPDGADTDDNAADFRLQSATAISTDAAAGAANIKVASVEDLAPGQTITIDSGDNRETAVIAEVGTAGGAATGAALAAGATEIPVTSAQGFNPGQTITVGSGDGRETAVIGAVRGGRGGRGNRGARQGGGGGGASITLTAPLAGAHVEGAEVAGSGITLAKGLAKPHAGGSPVASGVPTPGGPNVYAAASR